MLVIEGRAFRQGRIESAAIGIEGGTIVAIRKQLRGDPVYRYSDALILPGGVDVHVHFREPGMTNKDDFVSGTESAAVGGVTTVVDMPNTRPPVATREALQEKIRVASRSANVDFGLYGGPATASAVEDMKGATAFKVYLAESGSAAPVRADADLAGIARAVGGADTFLSAHCEDPERFAAGVAKSLADHNRNRPPEAEVAAIERLSRLGGSTRLHIAHITTIEGMKARPPGATCEATPHHLLMGTTSTLGSWGKVNPPLRPERARDALWREVLAGGVDMLASDHAPHTLDEKSAPFEDAPSGVPGVATTFPVLFRYVRRQILPLERFVSMFSENPAKLLRVNKGEIAVGREADLVVVDPRRIEKVTAARCRYKCGWTPFEGAEATFPTATFVRGELVAQEGELVTERVGRMITPSQS